MANQRDKDKRYLSAFLDYSIKNAILTVGGEQTQFLEVCVLRGLLLRKKITPAKVRALHESNRINSLTFEQLRDEGLL